MVFSFHHPGRFGDCIYALYTVKALGVGDITLTNFHTPSWGFGHATKLLSFLNYQNYINSAKAIEITGDELLNWRNGQQKPHLVHQIDYDLHDAEKDYNPDKFPEWDGNSWPGNCHIAKRYAVHFDIQWDPESIWLTAPKTITNLDIAIHAPHRRMAKPVDEWFNLINYLSEHYNIVILSGHDDYNEWDNVNQTASRVTPDDFLKSSNYINSAKCFLGVASSCNVIAEGLKKHRFVELADDCHNTYPYGDTGWCINGLSNDEIISLISNLI